MEEGNEFATLSELEMAIKQYEDSNYTNLRKSHTRSIKSARRKGTKRYVNPQLEYLEIDYRCIRSGDYKTKSTGLRPRQGTFRSGCPVVIKIRASKDGNKLVIKEFRRDHNHDTSQAIYNHLPRQRRLDTDARDMATKLVKLKINKKFLQSHLMESTGKVVTLKDINNLNSASKRIMNRRVRASGYSGKSLQKEIVSEPIIPTVKKRDLSYEERSRISKKITDELASLSAEATGIHFEERIKELLKLKQVWMCTDAGISPCAQPSQEDGSSFKKENVDEEIENNFAIPETPI